MSDLLLQAIHRIPEGSVILIRGADKDPYDENKYGSLVTALAEKVQHTNFIVVFLDPEETWQVESARQVHAKLGEFLARVEPSG